MAKVAFSKLKCKINDTEVPVQIGEETIMVKQYLPVQEKLRLIGRVIELAHDQDHNFSNPVKADVYRDLEILFAYTNLTFTDKQKEDLPKLYDLLISSNIIAQIIAVIPEVELQHLYSGINKSIEALYQYQNSVLGILDTLKTDYSQLDLDVNNLVDKIKNSDVDLSLVKGLLTNLNQLQ